MVHLLVGSVQFTTPQCEHFFSRIARQHKKPHGKQKTHHTQAHNENSLRSVPVLHTGHVSGEEFAVAGLLVGCGGGGAIMIDVVGTIENPDAEL